MKRLIAILIAVIGILNPAYAEIISYSGRLVQSNGSPVPGPVNMTFEVVADDGSSPASSWPVLCTVNKTGVALSNGVFNVSLDFATGTPCTPYADFAAVVTYTQANSYQLYLRFTDSTNVKTYPDQPISPVPLAAYALKGGTPGGYDLDTDAAHNCSAGQMLVRNGGGNAWICGDNLSQVIAGTGLSGGTITTTGTIAIASGGVSATQLATDAVTTVKILNANVTEAKLAGDAVTSAKIKDGEIVNADISSSAAIAYSKLAIADGDLTIAKTSGLQTALTNKADDSTTFTAGNGLSGGGSLGADRTFTVNVDNSTIEIATDTLQVKDVAHTKLTTACSDGQVITASTGRFVCANATAVGNWTLSGTDLYYTGGNVGVGTSSPISKFEVSGAARNTSSISNASTTIDFSTGNLQYTSANCGAFTLNNLKDGGSYTLAVKGTTSATCSFTAYTGSGTGALTVHLPTNHRPTTTGKHTLYTFLVMGSDAYVAFVPGL